MPRLTPEERIARAEALVSYLLSLRHDDPVPASMDYAPAAPAGDSQG